MQKMKSKCKGCRKARAEFLRRLKPMKWKEVRGEELTNGEMIALHGRPKYRFGDRSGKYPAEWNPPRI